MNKVIVLVFCLSFTCVFSQKHDKNLLKANAKYEEFSFVEARKLYKKLIEKGYQSDEIYASLGDTYFFNSDYVNALKWYSKLMQSGKKISLEYSLRYSVCLRSNNQHEDSFLVMNEYFARVGNPEEAKRWDPKEYLESIKQQSARYAGVSGVSINSGSSDFGAMLVPNEEVAKQELEIRLFEKAEKARLLRLNAIKRRKAAGNKLGTKWEIFEETQEDTSTIKKFEKLPMYKEVIYATAKDSGGIIKYKHNWNDKPYMKLYTAEIADDGMLVNEKKMGGAINTKYHQSTPAITKDGLTMYFTRLVPYEKEKKEKRKKNLDQIGQLKLFQARKVKNKWENVEELPYPINTAGASSAHPALSPDDKLLYFVSNRNKKTNDTDLYVIERKKGGGVARKEKSLGEEINTMGRETFPYVDGNGILYFASDGHPGLGGLDVFAAIKDESDKYKVVNIGEPINSTSDDFAYVIDSDSKKGFFSSNRKEGAGDDDVYKFLESKPVVFPFKLAPEFFGIVKDTITGKLLSGVEIKVYDERNEIIKTATTDDMGRYSLDLVPLKNYSFEYSKKGYQLEKVFVEGVGISGKKEMPIELFSEFSVIVDNKIVDLEEGDDLTDKLKLNPIYFDYGGYNLRKSSQAELDRIVALIKKRPSLSIEVRSHTDSRGKDDFNMKLSKNRAATTIDYIKEHGGFTDDRIWGDGYGESQLINNCGNGVECQESEHQLNRRSEFIIIIKE